MINRFSRQSLWILLTACLVGCTSVATYQAPIARFQTAVNLANDSIRPYLLGVNSLIAEANLYDKVALGQPWGTEDLKAGIPEHEISVRLQALSTLASYVNALAAVANARDADSLGQAAKTLGDNVNGLSQTFQSLGNERTAASAQSDIAKQTSGLDLGGPITSLVNLVGTAVIEHKQKEAVEKAILDGEKPVSQMIDLLKADLQALTLVDSASYDAKRTAMVKLYNDARSKTDAKGMLALIDQFVQDNNKLQTLRAIQVDALLSDLQDANQALVTFAKSGKQPKDVADLAAQIDVFTAHVKLFGDVVASIQSATSHSQ